MVNFADCVSKVQCRNLVTNTPTKNGIKTVLEKTVSNGKRLDSFSEAINVAVQNRAMYSMGAKEKSQNWLQKFIKKGLLTNDKPFATEILDSKFEPCGIPVGVKEMIVITPEYAKPLPSAEIIKKELQETLQQNPKAKNILQGN
ncbi:MAG: hypothetical protein E7Z89_04465 [Cyanobacteria bacterium SIG28]|nr:hypothetical protein [Cyanobacteria bacterium SIG28]